jgi:hypothetical protein
MATANVLQAEPERADLLSEIVRRRTERLTRKSKGYARTVPIASDIDPASCRRRQVLEIVRWQDKPLFEAATQARFEAGNIWEDQATIALKTDGFQVVAEQVPFELTRRGGGDVVLRGRIDGKIRWGLEEIPFEVKSMNPIVFDHVSTVDDLARYWWTTKYMPQLQAYLVGHGHPWGFFYLTNMAGQWKALRVELDYAMAERIWAFAESIVDGVQTYRADGTLPGYTSAPTQCAHCDFFGRTCNPDIVEQGARFLEDPDLHAQLERWNELRGPAKEYGSLDKRVKEALRKALPGPDARGIAGHFAVQISERQVKGFEVKPRTDRIVEIEELVAGGGNA